MSKEAGFLIYCMERYRHFKGLSGSKVADLFESCKVDEYIMKYFESLHTMGEQYIIKDIMQLGKVNYKVIQESSTAVQAFINGELDVVSTSDTNWGKTITAAGDSQEMTVPSSAPDFFMFNLKNEYLSNTKIRQALSIAFDRQEMVDTLRDGMSVPIYSMMPDTMKVGDKTYTELVDGKNYFVTQMQEESKGTSAGRSCRAWKEYRSVSDDDPLRKPRNIRAFQEDR